MRRRKLGPGQTIEEYRWNATVDAIVYFLVAMVAGTPLALLLFMVVTHWAAIGPIASHPAVVALIIEIGFHLMVFSFFVILGIDALRDAMTATEDREVESDSEADILQQGDDDEQLVGGSTLSGR